MIASEFEELRLAAIAAGYKPVRLTDECKAFLLEGLQKPWNPLTDDGDALRLAVKLHMGVSIHNNHCMACAPHGMAQAVKDMPTDEATRLAITRAAAEIGKQMGGSDV